MCPVNRKLSHQSGLRPFSDPNRFAPQSKSDAVDKGLSICRCPGSFWRKSTRVTLVRNDGTPKRGGHASAGRTDKISIELRQVTIELNLEFLSDSATMVPSVVSQSSIMNSSLYPDPPHLKQAKRLRFCSSSIPRHPSFLNSGGFSFQLRLDLIHGNGNRKAPLLAQGFDSIQWAFKHPLPSPDHLFVCFLSRI